MVVGRDWARKMTCRLAWEEQVHVGRAYHVGWSGPGAASIAGCAQQHERCASLCATVARRKSGQRAGSGREYASEVGQLRQEDKQRAGNGKKESLADTHKVDRNM